ncbi:MAG: hypothetical protein GY862_28195 [Gammaproteobacteria bacterium]|nr:hypothetical protein [Gammaproteobacteria bacterium]
MNSIIPKSHNRFDVLNDSTEAVTDRSNVYGPPDVIFARAAKLASVILEHKLKEPLTATDWNLMMAIALEGSRLIENPDHHGSQVDMAGYASLLSEVA